MKTEMISSLMIATVAAVGYLHADQPSQTPRFAQDESLKANQATAAYNIPACTNIKNGRDWFASASFLYWHIGQEGMGLALGAEIGPNVNSNVTEVLIPNSTTLFQKFDSIHRAFRWELD